MIEPDLRDLLTIMRNMHFAAISCQWDVVNKLDIKREEFLNRVKSFPEVTIGFDRTCMREIIELDYAVMELACQGMDLVAEQTRSTPAQMGAEI